MMTTRQNPWPGLASYDEKNGMFCGRSAAVNDLFSLICNNPVITLYGRSGIGKTSLVKAGVAPILRRRGYMPVYVRLMQEIQPGGEQGVFARCITAKLEEAIPGIGKDVPFDTPAGQPEYLWEWFLSHPMKDAAGEPVTPVLILDQFEEIFFYKEEEVRLLLRQIALLLDDSRRLPDSCDPEEFRSRFRFVFSFRDDALYKMEEAADRDNLSALKQNRYILKALKRDQAGEVILLPAEDIRSGRRFVSREVADCILDKLSGGEGDEVDPAILSLLMSELYDKMVDAGATEITEEFVSSFGGDIIRNYYLKGVSRIRPGALSFLERELVTADGRRRSVASGDMAGIVRQDDLDKLLESHILSAVVKGEVVDYELSHDVLCPIVQQNRRRRWARRRITRIAAFAALFCALVAAAFLGWNLVEKAQRKRQAEYEEVQQQRDTAQAKNRELQDSLFRMDRRQIVEYAYGCLMEGNINDFKLIYMNEDESVRSELEKRVALNDYMLRTGYFSDIRISENKRYIYYGREGRAVIIDVIGKVGKSRREKFWTLMGSGYNPDQDSLKCWKSLKDIKSLSYVVQEKPSGGRSAKVDISIKDKKSDSDKNKTVWAVFICIRELGGDHEPLSAEWLRQFLGGYKEKQAETL